MCNVNDIILNKHIIIGETFEQINHDKWYNLEYNEEIYIEKTDGLVGKYYFKSINDKYIMCSNLKYKSNSFTYKYIPFKFLKTNIKKIHRQSKINTNIDLMNLNTKLKKLEDDIVTIKNENKLLVGAINKIIKAIST